MDFEILLLGPLTVRTGGAEIHLGGRNAQVVLGTLLVGVNHWVTVEELVWAVWKDARPRSAENSAQTYVSRLRRQLGFDSIAIRNHSDELRATCDQVDSCRFERLLSEAGLRLASDPVSALELAREALRLWRGPPFGELAYEDFAQLETIRLNELRLATVELELEAELATGGHREAVARLQSPIQEHPLRERFWQMLIRGLNDAGRRPEAIRAYDDYRRVLQDNGLEPQNSVDALLTG